jgi:hypothetical protein
MKETVKNMKERKKKLHYMNDILLGSYKVRLLHWILGYLLKFTKFDFKLLIRN